MISTKNFSTFCLSCLIIVIAVIAPWPVAAAPVIVPTVQQMQIVGGQPAVVDDSWAIIANLSDADEIFNADYLKDYLVKEFGIDLPVHDVSSVRANADKRFVLGKPDASLDLAAIVQNKGIALPGSFAPEEYLLDSSQQDGLPDVFVLAGQSAGVFYGIQSLLKHPNGSFQSLIVGNNEIQIERLVIVDQPDKSIRGVFFRLSSSDHFSEVYEWIDVMSRFKLNLVVFGQDTSELVDLDQIFAYARRRYMEPVPFLRGLNGGSVVEEDVNIAEGVPVVDEAFWFSDEAGTYVAEPVIPVYQTDLIANSGFEQQVDLFSVPWSFSGSTHWSWDTTTSHSGGASVKMHVPEVPLTIVASEQLNQGPNAYIAVEAGESYTLSFWAKAENVSKGPGPIVRTTELDANLNFAVGTFRGNSTIRLPSGSTDWRQYVQPLVVGEETRFLAISSFTDKEGFGTVWLDDFELRRMNGALVNVLRTEATDIRVKSQDRLTTYQEGVDYQVVGGDFKFRTVVDGVIHSLYPLNQPARIELIPSGNIDPSATASIDYDFAVMPVTGAFRHPQYSIHDPWTYSRHVFPYLSEMIGALQPVYALYSGASEVAGINRDSRNNGASNVDLVALDINTVYGHLKSIAPDLQIFIWDDMMSPWHNGDDPYRQSENGAGATGATEPQDLVLPRVTDMIPRTDIIQWAWWYREDTDGRIANTPDYLDGLSFQWVVSPEDELANIVDWVVACDGRPNCLGMIDWAASTYDGIEPMADFAWNSGAAGN